MVTNLFDEMKFFHSYPPKELRTTAELFGQIIKNKLIDGVVINIGLKCILDALKSKGGMLDFGKFALTQCIEVIDQVEYLEHLVNIEGLKEAVP